MNQAWGQQPARRQCGLGAAPRAARWEDLARYGGPPRLIRAAGTESFDTVADGSR
jgi:hypothetical protein